MALTRRVISQSFPYFPVTVMVQGHIATVSAFLDTGFDGDIAVPRDFFPPHITADHDTRWGLADGSRILVPTYVGIAQVGQFAPFRVATIALGDELIAGRGLINDFTVILDLPGNSSSSHSARHRS